VGDAHFLTDPLKLNALQRRGEKIVLTSDHRRLEIKVDQTRCLGEESCSALAPMVFALDLKHFKDGEPLGMKDVADETVESEAIIVAARSCPYKAIFVTDIEHYEELAP
jgi:ferredoxin